MEFTVIVCTVLIIHAIGVIQLVMVKEGKREGYSFSDSFGVLSFLLPIFTVHFPKQLVQDDHQIYISQLLFDRKAH